MLAAFVAVRVGDPSTWNHDVGWVLTVAERILDGAHFPHDWLDPNPPGIFWLSAAPVAIARALGAPPFAVFDAVVACAIAASLAACHRLLREGWPDAAPGGPLALCGWLAAALTLLPGYEFGQREHLAVIAILPYLIGSARALAGRPLGPRMAIAVGAVAGAGIAIKPFFLLAPAAVALLVWRERGARAIASADHLTIAVVQLLYAFALAAFAPVRCGGRARPAPSTPRPSLDRCRQPRDADRDARVRCDAPVPSDARDAPAAPCAGAASRSGPPLPAAPRLVLSLLPADSARRADRSVAPGCAAHPRSRSWRHPLGRPSLGVELAAGRPAPRPSRVAGLARIVRDIAADQPVLFLSTAVGPAFPVVLRRARWARELRQLRRSTRPTRPRSRSATARATRWGRRARAVDAVVDDLARYRPGLIFVDRARVRQAIGASAFDFVSYFSRDPRFAALFADYRDIGDAPRFRVYQRAAAP